MAAAPAALLGGLAQGRVAAEVAGLDQEEGVGVEVARRRGASAPRRPAGRGAARSLDEPQAHQPPAADQRKRHQLALQPRRVGVEVGVGEQRHVERIVGPLGDLGGQRLGALAHHALVAAVDQRGADRRVRDRPGSARCRDGAGAITGSAAFGAFVARHPGGELELDLRRAASEAARSWVSWLRGDAGVGLRRRRHS